MAGTIDIESVIDGQKSTVLRSIVVACCFVVMFFDGYDLNLVGYVGPALIAYLHLSAPVFGTAVSAGLLGFMLGAFLLGNLGDRLGRKRMTIFGTFFFGLLTLTCVWAHSLTTLMVLRFLAGVGMGGAVPNAISLNMELSPKWRSPVCCFRSSFQRDGHSTRACCGWHSCRV